MGSTCDYNKKRKPNTSRNKVSNNPFLNQKIDDNDSKSKTKKITKKKSPKKKDKISSKNSLKIDSEKVAFPPGENYYH